MLSTFLKVFRNEELSASVNRNVGEVVKKMEKLLTVIEPQFCQDAAETINNAAVRAIVQECNLAQRKPAREILQQGPFTAGKPLFLAAGERGRLQ